MTDTDAGSTPPRRPSSSRAATCRRPSSSTRPSRASRPRNPALNAVIHERFELARSEAARRSAHAARPADRPLRGVPFLVKDAVCHTAGDPFHCGMRLLKRLRWTEPDDTWLAARFRAAGLVFVGKTNTPELATSVTTEPLAYGADPQSVGSRPLTRRFERRIARRRSPSGMVAIAHGNDMGGSIRFPASMCGIVGLKPTRARTTLGPDFGEYWGPLTHEHVLTRSVRDTALVLDAVAGAGPRRSLHRAAAGAPVPRRGRRAAGCGYASVCARARRDGAESAPDCVRAVDETGRLLESLGHHVRAGRPPRARRADRRRVRHRHDGRRRARPRALERAHRRGAHRRRRRARQPLPRARWARRSPASPTRARSSAMQSWSRGVAAWWEDHDILVTPTSPEPPVPLGELGADQLRPGRERRGWGTS